MLKYSNEIKPTDLEPERVKGCGRLSIQKDGSLAHLENIYQSGSAKIRIHGQPPAPSIEATLINTAGGLTSGDQLNWSVSAGEDTQLSLTTPAAEKIYMAAEKTATIKTSLTVGKATHMVWLPQETILFNGAKLQRKLEVNLEKDASLLMAESYVFGRKAMQENMTSCLLEDRWRVYHQKTLVHREDFCHDTENFNTLTSPTNLSAMTACATIIYIAENALDLKHAIQSLCPPVASGVIAAVSAWHLGGINKLIVRIIGEDGYSVKQHLIPIIRRLNNRQLPKSWLL